MYTIISLGLIILGLVLFFAPEYIVSKDTENKNLKFIYENHQVLGFLFSILSLYFYIDDTTYDNINMSTDLNSGSQAVSRSATHSGSQVVSHSGTNSGSD